MGFSRQEYCSGLPFPSPGDLPDPGIEPRSPALQADSLPSVPPGKPHISEPECPTRHKALCGVVGKLRTGHVTRTLRTESEWNTCCVILQFSIFLSVHLDH